MTQITLIANSGIQFLKFEIELNPNDDITKALRFHDYQVFNKRTFSNNRFLEYAVFLTNQNAWVTKASLVREGCFDEKTGNLIEEKINPDDLDKIDSQTEGFSINNFDTNIRSSLYRDKTAIEHFENKWLPVPYFELNEAGESQSVPVNWSRMMLSPKEGKGRKGSRFYDVILAFDTRATDDDGNLFSEYPMFSFRDTKKLYALCNNTDILLKWVNSEQCAWLDEYLIKLVHGDVNSLPQEFPYSKYKAYYIYLMHYLHMKGDFPEIKLFNDKANDAESVSVDLVLDIGNSRTCGLLFEDSDFTKVSMLALQDMTHPERVYSNPFDMRLAFREAKFGEIDVQYSNQFKYPSVLRVGEEASWLIYNAKHTEDGGVEKVTNYSSPKRYLWDSERFSKQWEFILLENELPNPTTSIYLKGISEQLDSDGSLRKETINTGIKSSYSRLALSTFVFLEILAQAQRQINSHEFREKHGQISYPRRINRMIITCPTAMTGEEQLRLRRCAEEASVILKRFTDGTYDNEYDPETNQPHVEIVPSVRELSFTLEDIELKKDWGYDEATCCQLVFIYAEVAKRYLNNCKEYFELYGKVRKDLAENDDYHKKSVTIGSIDIGAGTTDLMICAYKYDDGAKAVLTPVPLFWESFYYAGDDLLKEVIRQVIIEGSITKEEYRGACGVIQNKLMEIGAADVNAKINNFFGGDSNQMSYKARRMRVDFNTQVSVPIALKLLDMTQKREKDQILTYEDFFTSKQPNKDLTDYFAEYFGFRFEELKWKFSIDRMNEIVIRVFEPLLKKLSSLLYAYGCDFVLLAGKPTSLHHIEELFLKFYPTPPNRIITLNKYRVGRWYPFADGNGYFSDQKSLVAVGAMIGYMGDVRDSLGNFKLNMDVMRKRFRPTSEYFGNFDRVTKNIRESFIEPTVNTGKFSIAGTPACIGTKQLNTPAYQARAMYIFDFDDENIAAQIAKNRYGEEHKLSADEKEFVAAEVEKYKLNIKKNMPLNIRLVREYRTDKERLTIDDIVDRNKDDVASSYFNMKLQTLSESENFWLDSGEFVLQTKNN